MNFFLNKKNKYILVKLFFLIFVVFLFSVSSSDANAKNCTCVSIDTSSGYPVSTGRTMQFPDGSDCYKECKNKGFDSGNESQAGNNTDGTPVQEMTEPVTIASATEDICPGVSILSPSTWFKCLLLIILRAEGIALEIAQAIFKYIVDPTQLNLIINNATILEMWGFVRDLLNFAFVMILLFSAFCTIFQVEKYNYKKILLTLVIMALLVNFSYPIVRFIIDVSNVLMYTLLNNIGGSDANNSYTQIANYAGIQDIVKPKISDIASTDVSFLLLAVVFVFIFMITLFTISILLLIRAIALAILIIFSSIAFIGAAFPDSKSKVGQYWDYLFKYAFFGPIMIFMLMIAVKMMATIGQNGGGFAQIIKLNGNNVSYPNLVATITFYFVPIVILWIGIGMAQKMGVYGADYVTNKSKDFMKWAGGRLSGYDYVKTVGKKIWDTRKQQRQTDLHGTAGRILSRWDDITGRGLGAVSGGRFGRERRLRAEEEHDKQVREYMKNIDNKTNGDELANHLNMARNDAEREAILRRAAAVGEIETILNRNGYANDGAGFSDFMQNQFGDNDRSARLASSIASIENKNNNRQYSGTASYNNATGRYEFNAPGSAARRGDIFNAVGGVHPENIARNLRSGMVVTTGPGGVLSFNNDFENFLTDMGADFNSTFLTGGNAVRNRSNIPGGVIRDLQRLLTGGWVPPAGSSIELLVNALIADGRL